MSNEIEDKLSTIRTGPSPVPLSKPPSLTARKDLQRSNIWSLQKIATSSFRAIAFMSLLAALAAQGPALILNYSEWRKATAAADNAAVQQHAAAVGLKANADKELQVARNAAVRLKAEADQAQAEADKAEQDVVTKQNEAHAAMAKAKADADTLVAQALLSHEEAISKLPEAQLAASAMKTEAEKAEQQLKSNRYVLRQTVYLEGMINCPGTTYIAKINAAADGQCNDILKHY